jgi:Tfp pilus assembly protein FimT
MLNHSQLGYSLLEILVGCFVISLCTFLGLQSSNSYLDNISMKRAVTHVHTAFTTARDTAYGLKRDLWLHIAIEPYSAKLALHIDSEPRRYEAIMSNALRRVDVEEVQLQASSSIIRFAGLNGKPHGKGHVSLSVNNDSMVKIIFHDITGRIRICGQGKQHYGYPEC